MARRPMARFLAALLVVTSCVSAHAYQPGRTPGPPVGIARIPDAVACNRTQSAAIEQAFREARHRVARAIAFIDANPGHRHLRVWFGDEVRPAYVRARYVQIALAMQPGRRPAIYCGTPACPSFARSWRQLNTVALCTLFWRARASGTDSRFGVIIHEVSHLAVGSIDFVYGPAQALALARRDSERAMQNADNIEYFVEHLPASRAGR